MRRQTPSYKGLRPASPTASFAHARSAHSGTACEKELARGLLGAGLRYRKNVAGLPGKPDFVFPRARVVVFCDGDFWHGKDWEQRKAKLAKGSNAPYWVQKIETNMARDKRKTSELEALGWRVIRVWESDVRADVSSVVTDVASAVAASEPATAGRSAKARGDSERGA